MYSVKHILIVYIYITLKYIDEIKKLPNISNIRYKGKELSDNNQKILYDFINFGNTSTEIKTRIVNACIFNLLRNKNSVQIEDIIKESNNYFENGFTPEFYNRVLENLKRTKKIDYVDKGKKSIRLTDEESAIIQKSYENFETNRKLFFMYYDDLLKKYNIEEKKDELLNKLESFFENNFNIDLCEIYCEEINCDNASYAPLLDYLKGITDSENVNNLFKDILLLCEDNDFLLRISVSKVFSKISNPDQFQNYLSQQKRIVYLDSQIILYALCCNYLDNDKYDNIYHKITNNLLNYISRNQNIELKFGNQYLSEIAYQLKMALLLIPFADNNNTAEISISTNIFYQFYYYLKNNGLLDYETNTFADFMYNLLSLEEDDAYDSDYEKIASKLIIRTLDDLNIKVITFPFYEEWESTYTLLDEVIKNNLLSIKSHYVLKNDAIMVCHLSNCQLHINEPFFLTWDKSFTQFRKAFKDKYNRRDSISWHLFTPSKFLNHMDLINFKIDPSSVTNDFISVMDGLGVHDMTRTVVDSMNRLSDIKNISKDQRHKYIRIIKDIFTESEFSYGIDAPIEEKKIKISNSFADILDQINNYLNNDSQLGIEKYRKMLLNESYFIQIAELIKARVKLKLSNPSLNNVYPFQEIENYIKKYEDESTKSLIE